MLCGQLLSMGPLLLLLELQWGWLHEKLLPLWLLLLKPLLLLLL
jgi:hypothetical protein